ncbi:MAG: integrase core domain-containing protein [Bacillota bacterium]
MRLGREPEAARSPWLNGVVESVNTTHKEKFWACYDSKLRLEPKRWMLDVYNHLRLHQSLRYKSPAQYLELLAVRECLT